MLTERAAICATSQGHLTSFYFNYIRRSSLTDFKSDIHDF